MQLISTHKEVQETEGVDRKFLQSNSQELILLAKRLNSHPNTAHSIIMKQKNLW